MIERNFAERIELTKDDESRIILINDEAGVEWLFSFLSADKKKSDCLYEAPSADAIPEAARKANVPADVILEVSIIYDAGFIKLADGLDRRSPLS